MQWVIVSQAAELVASYRSFAYVSFLPKAAFDDQPKIQHFQLTAPKPTLTFACCSTGPRASINAIMTA